MKFNETILDTSSVTGAVFKPAVPSGLTSFGLFGGTLTRSLQNFANPSAVFTVGGTPTFNSNNVDVGPSSTINLSDAPSTGSETLFAVFSITPGGGPANGQSYRAYPFAAGQVGGDVSYGNYFTLDTGTPALNYQAQFSDSGGTRHSVSANGVSADGNILAQSVASQTIIATPQLYRVKIDMTGMTLSFTNMSQSASRWSSSVNINAGYTRATIAQDYSLAPGNTPATWANSDVKAYLWARYNRATTLTEDAAIYAQIQRVMAIRGVAL